MGVIKIDNVIYGSNNSADIIYKNTTVEEKLDTIPIFDINDNGNVIIESDVLTYGHIINTLDSDATDKVLSAKQGKILNEKFDNIDFSALENDINLNRESIDLLNETIDVAKADIKINETAIKNLNNQVDVNINNINILNNSIEKIGEVDANYLNENINNIGKLLNYYIANGFLPDANIYNLLPIFNGSNTVTENGLVYKVSAQGQYSNDYAVWKAVDGSTSSDWCFNQTNTNCWFKVSLPNKKFLKQIEVKLRGATTITIHGSNDDSTWELVKTITGIPTFTLTTQVINSAYSYQYYRFTLSATSGTEYNGLSWLKLYGN